MALPIRFLVDQNVPDAVPQFLQERGYEVTLIRDVFPTDVEDPVIAKAADDYGAVCVTNNHKHFKGPLGRRPPVGERMLRHSSRISFTCRETVARRRLEEHIDSIEFEWQRAQQRSDKRVLIEISERGLFIER